MAAAAPARALAPAQLFMRWIPELLGNFPIVLGQAAITIPLDMVGYLDLLIVHVKGTITVANAPLVFNQLMPWNIITNFLVQPPGQTPPFRIGGQMLHAWNLIAPDYSPFEANDFGVPYSNRGTGAGVIDPINTTSIDVFNKAVGAGQVIHLWYNLPFHRSSMDVRGVLPLGNRTRTNLVMSIAAAADLVTVAANITAQALSADVYQCYYTPPSLDSGAAVDPYWAVTYDQAQQVIAAVGAQAPIDIVPDDTILGILHGVAVNNALDSTAISTIALQVNESWLLGQQAFPFDAWEYIQNRQHGLVLPTGFIFYDLDDSVDDGLMDVKKWLHTDRVNKIRSYVTIAAGATLGTGPSIFTSTRRLVDLNPAAHAAALG